jgi:endonuclease YncB( thermonuclease family)
VRFRLVFPSPRRDPVRFAAFWVIAMMALVVALIMLGDYRQAHAAEPPRCMALTVEAGQVKRVIDGDTYVLYTVGLTDEEHVRMLGGDAWELRDPLGPAARDSAALWLRRGAFTISSCRRDSFGRLLAWTVRNGDSLHVYLRERGLLKP